MTVQIDIPGGTATLRSDRSELTERMMRPIQLIGMRLGRAVMDGLPTAGRILCEGDVIDDRTSQVDDHGERVFPGPDLDLSERQLAHLHRMGEAVTWALLVSWTLDLPLPDSPDGMLDLPQGVYRPLADEAARINARMGSGGFDLDEAMDTVGDDGEPDQTLPTGA